MFLTAALSVFVTEALKVCISGVKVCNCGVKCLYLRRLKYVSAADKVFVTAVLSVFISGVKGL